MSYDTPECLGIMLCDQVIEDKRSNKKSVIGIFNDIMVCQTPVKHPMMTLLITLTNCRGLMDVKINITCVGDYGDDPIMQIKGRIDGKNPLNIVDLIFELRDLPLPGIGQYNIELLTGENDQVIANRHFFVKMLPKLGPPPQQQSTGEPS